MAPTTSTPRRSGASRPRKSTADRTRPRSSGSTRPSRQAASTSRANESPPKKRKYIPGGPGGGGRYVDEDGEETPVGGTGPGGYNYVGPRGRIGRENAAKGVQPVIYPRRDRSTRTRNVESRSQQSPGRHSTSAAAAAAVQSEGNKPREERGWEEFHPDLDIDAKFRAFSADEVDGYAKSQPATPGGGSNGSSNGTVSAQTPNGDNNVANGDNTPSGSVIAELPRPVIIPGQTPGTKRRPGRPPRDPVAFYAAKEAASNGIFIANTPKTPRLVPIQNQQPKERLKLPQPSYRKVDAFSELEKLGRYVEKSMAHVGYQESDKFVREYTMIKASDGAHEDDLDINTEAGKIGRVEYDMDEQDDKWLQDYNLNSRKDRAQPITREVFEITMTKIEKEWHALEKRIPKPNPKPPQTHRPRSSSAAAVNGEPAAGEEQDTKCAVCDDGDCENANAIIFCDGCDLAVHQECYGVPYIPEGQWHCRKCQIAGRGIATCIFCPNTDGAFKQVDNTNKWAHLLCAMWIPEVYLSNHTYMEPVTDVARVPKTRWRLNCYLCKQKMGACIQCGNKACYQAFHVTCARRARLFLKMKSGDNRLSILDGTTALKAFCDKHCPEDYAKDNDVAGATRAARKYYKRAMRGRIWADNQVSADAIASTQRIAMTENEPDQSQAIGASISHSLSESKKKGDQQPKSVWKLPSGAPVIPSVVFDAVETSLQRYTIIKRKDFVAEVCKYWTLKRESRRGAALLKRLQLQMETFSSMEITRRNFAAMGPSGLQRLQRRIEFAENLVNQLDLFKVITDDVKERELEKRNAATLELEVVDSLYFPIVRLLEPIMEKILRSADNGKVFSAGFEELQKKVNDRHHVLATHFAYDLAKVISKGIEGGCKTQNPQSSAEGVDELALSPSKQAGNDIKERRKVGKRIVKQIQPWLEAAIRAEGDLCRKDPTPDLEHLVTMFDSAYEGRPFGPLLDAEAEPLDAEAMQIDSHDANGEGNDSNGNEGAAAVDDPMDIDQNEEREGSSARPAENGDVESETTAALAAQLSQNMSGASKETSTAFAHQNSDTPPDTNGYVSAPENQPACPPTPAISASGPPAISDPADVLVNGGGIPWYVKDFDPVGTSVANEQWSGRDVIRGMSEELSELGDEEMKDLGAAMEAAQPAAAASTTLAVPTPKRKPAKKKRSRYR